MYRRGELSERQQRLNQHLMRIVKHAEVIPKYTSFNILDDYSLLYELSLGIQCCCSACESSYGGSRSKFDVWSRH